MWDFLEARHRVCRSSDLRRMKRDPMNYNGLNSSSKPKCNVSSYCTGDCFGKFLFLNPITEPIRSLGIASLTPGLTGIDSLIGYIAVTFCRILRSRKIAKRVDLVQTTDAKKAC
jgi:hypothetical protein